MNKDIIDVMIEDKVENIDKIVEKDCKIKPKNILFIDDNKENIEGAKNEYKRNATSS